MDLEFFIYLFFNSFCSQGYGGLSVPRFLLYVQDAGIRTRGAANAARCANNELHIPNLEFDINPLRKLPY